MTSQWDDTCVTRGIYIRLLYGKHVGSPNGSIGCVCGDFTLCVSRYPILILDTFTDWIELCLAKYLIINVIDISDTKILSQRKMD